MPPQIGLALVIALVFASGPLARPHDGAWPRKVPPTGTSVVDQPLAQTHGLEVTRHGRLPLVTVNRAPKTFPLKVRKKASLICNSNGWTGRLTAS
jgi:hypothetical protein